MVSITAHKPVPMDILRAAKPVLSLAAAVLRNFLRFCIRDFVSVSGRQLVPAPGGW